MQISSRFTVALHIFTCVDAFKDEHKVTSDFLASSINTNPVIVRRLLTKLKKAGLIKVARGPGGLEVTRPLLLRRKIRMIYLDFMSHQILSVR